ncbi:MAG: hypothetical protein HFG00_01280 [Oscillibacter sp.]|nr:hypothetical protein [Oscillibacter sp.]
MEPSECLIRFTVGDTRASIHPLTCASEIIGGLFFVEHTPLESIRAKEVYPSVAKLMGLSCCAATRRVQRLSLLCWECMREKDLVCQYIGRPLQCSPDACRLIGYLTVYAYLRVPFFEIIKNNIWLSAPPFDFSGQTDCGITSDSVRRTVCPKCGLTTSGELLNFCSSCGHPLCGIQLTGNPPFFSKKQPL